METGEWTACKMGSVSFTPSLESCIVCTCTYVCMIDSFSCAGCLVGEVFINEIPSSHSSVSGVMVQSSQAIVCLEVAVAVGVSRTLHYYRLVSVPC